jgi:cytochrome c-type biogenesis protein
MAHTVLWQASVPATQVTQQYIQVLRMESAPQISVFIALGAGLLSFISPCVLPLFPAYLSFITGMSATALHNEATLRQHRRQIILHALCFIAGFSLIFVVLGASFSLLGSLLRAHLDLLQRVGGAVIIFFGLLLVGLFKIPLLMRTVGLRVHHKPVGYVGAFLVGVSFAVGWTPCVGPILGSILFLASTAAEVDRGMVLLSVYSLGLAIPFFLSSLAVPAFFQLFGRVAAYLRAIEVGGGVLMILVGLLVLTGYFTVLNSYALRLVPAWLWQYL